MSGGERFRVLRYPRLDVRIYRLDTAWYRSDKQFCSSRKMSSSFE